MSDTMTEGVIDSWVKKVGDTVRSGDVLAEVETDKATMELESYTDGVLLYIGVKQGETVPVDAVIAIIGKQGEDYKALLNQGSGDSAKQSAQQAVKEEAPVPAAISVQETKPEPKASEIPKENTGAENGRLMVSPLAKKMAEEKGIPLEKLSGSGDSGRIVRRDIENYKESSSANTSLPASSTQTVAGKESYVDVPLSQMRKTIARRLSESKFTAPHFYLTVDINMGRLVEARKKLNDFLGEKVSYNDIIIRAAAAALRYNPKVNASWMGDKIRYYDHIHIGVAIAVEEGLVVPVIKFADSKGIAAIAQEVKLFAEKAKNKKLLPPDFEGNTFTISNLGMFGIEEFTAIINPPDACIMAVGAIREVPIVVDGNIQVGHMMKVTLSCDHRVVDGAKGAKFLQTFKQILEEPVIILA